jgi:hypothetical protein
MNARAQAGIGSQQEQKIIEIKNEFLQKLLDTP